MDALWRLFGHQARTTCVTCGFCLGYARVDRGTHRHDRRSVRRSERPSLDQRTRADSRPESGRFPQGARGARLGRRSVGALTTRHGGLSARRSPTTRNTQFAAPVPDEKPSVTDLDRQRIRLIRPHRFWTLTSPASAPQSSQRTPSGVSSRAAGYLDSIQSDIARRPP